MLASLRRLLFVCAFLPICLSSCHPTTPDPDQGLPAAIPSPIVGGPGYTATSFIPAQPSAKTSPTSTFTPTITPTNTPTPLPTLTPTLAGPLPATGPFFLFLDRKVTPYKLILLGEEGEGRKEIPLTQEAQFGDCITCLMSPDGLWFVFWEGNAWPRSDGEPGQYDLRLQLINTSDASISTITTLLSSDYPNNFRKSATDYTEIRNLPKEQIEGYTTNFRDSFLFGIHSAAWSPKGRFLAFAGEMDGPSSDLYVFDTTLKSVRRLSSGPTNIMGMHYKDAIRWSPDGQWILYSGGYFVGMGGTVHVFAVKPDGSSQVEFNFSTDSVGDWLTPSTFPINQSNNGVGSYDYRIADINTGGAVEVWRCPFAKIIPDAAGYALIFTSNYAPDEWECPIPGLYFTSFYAGYTRLVIRGDDPAIEAFYQDRTWNDTSGIIKYVQGNRRFLVYQNEVGSSAITTLGEMVKLGQEDLFPYPSPNNSWVALARNGLRLMDKSGKISELLTDMRIDNVNWLPNSTGFLMNSGAELFSFSIPDMKITRLDGIDYPGEPRNIHWQPDSRGFFFTSGYDLFFLSLKDQSIKPIQHLEDIYPLQAKWVSAPR